MIPLKVIYGVMVVDLGRSLITQHFQFAAYDMSISLKSAFHSLLLWLDCPYCP